MTDNARSGLDIDVGNRCSRVAWDWSRTTLAARQGKPGASWGHLEASFASLLDFGGVRIGITSDGIGTKIELAERVGDYSTLGWDLTAMVSDDLAANGIEPTNLSNILDVDRLDERIVSELLEGLANATRESGIAIAGGEIAELGARVGGWGDRMHFNWCATAIGVLPAGVDPVDGKAVAVDDVVVSVKERGFRSNGFSLVREVMEGAFGEAWHEAPYDGSQSWGRVLLTPSRVCAPLVAGLIAAGVVPHGIANITGGGIPDKLGRVLKVKQLGASLGSLHEPLPFMRALSDLGVVRDERAYRMWNMGNAMLLVLAPGDVARACATATELGFETRAAGHVTADPVIRIAAPHGDLAYPTPARTAAAERG
jgi:phosphoribosylformylglycinamidine cyclo-ligase